jgi:hypothetical protein
LPSKATRIQWANITSQLGQICTFKSKNSEAKEKKKIEVGNVYHFLTKSHLSIEKIEEDNLEKLRVNDQWEQKEEKSNGYFACLRQDIQFSFRCFIYGK